MTGRKGLAVFGVVIAFLAVTLAFAQNWGWSTPFALPAVIGYDGHSYYIDADTPYGRACYVSPAKFVEGHTNRLPKAYSSFRRTGSVFGYSTTSNPILLPRYEWHRRLPFLLLVRDGGCLRDYTLPPSYGP